MKHQIACAEGGEPTTVSVQTPTSESGTASTSTGPHGPLYSLPGLSDSHADLIRESCISPEVARERGYQTVNTQVAAAAIGFTKTYQQRVPALAIPVYDTKGLMRYWRLRPDNPRLDLSRKGRPVKYETPSGQSPCLDVPRRCRPALSDASIPLFVTEGERKADCLASHGRCVIGLPGVWMGQRKGALLTDWEDVALKGRVIYICFDSDACSNPDVGRAERSLKKALLKKGAEVVHVLRVPPAEDGGKQGIDDYIYSGGKIDDLVPKTNSSTSSQKLIVFNPADLTHHVDQAEDALARCPEVFVFRDRISRLVRPNAHDGGQPRARLQPLDKAAATELISKSCAWQRSVGSRLDSVVTPREVLDSLFSRSNWPRIRRIERLVHHPFVDRNGDIILTTGYYPKLRIYLDANVAISPIPDKISDADVRRAIATLREPTKGVCFEDDHSRDVSPLAILTVIDLPNGAKPPCFFITAPFPGSGKSVFANIGHIVAFGECAPTATLSSSNEETRKALTTYVRDGRSVVVLDNIPNGHHVASADLDQFLTSKVRLDRQLGKNESIEASSNLFIILTGNNITAGEDTLRRIVHCRIRRPYPQMHSGHSNHAVDPNSSLIKSRPELMRAALIVIAAYRRGSTTLGSKGIVIPSFEEWSRGVLHPFLAAGGCFAVGSAESLADTDDWTTEATRGVIRAAIDNGGAGGFTTADVVRWSDLNSEIKGYLETAVGEGTMNARKIGRFIARVRGRPVEVGANFASIESRSRPSANNSREWYIKSEPIEPVTTTPESVEAAGSRVSGFPGFETEIPRTEAEIVRGDAGDHTRTYESGAETEPGKPGNPGGEHPAGGTGPPRNEPPTYGTTDEFEYDPADLREDGDVGQMEGTE